MQLSNEETASGFLSMDFFTMHVKGVFFLTNELLARVVKISMLKKTLASFSGSIPRSKNNIYDISMMK